jgi:uncharacterized protein
MGINVLFSEDPAFVLNRQPVLHNLILTILHARVAQGDPGRYWMAVQREDTVGVVVQSPLTFPATLTPMEPPVTTAMADAIAEAGVALPGINGEAATAALFAGQWSERSKSAATPSRGIGFTNF